jgi:hypothetical protein
MVVCMIVAMG